MFRFFRFNYSGCTIAMLLAYWLRCVNLIEKKLCHRNIHTHGIKEQVVNCERHRNIENLCELENGRLTLLQLKI